MLKPLSISLSVMLLLASVGCSSTPHVRSNPPPAWMLQPAPDLLMPLNGIISPSEIESKSPESK
ncbi:Rz1 family lipoprotein [Serratia bockelmannii]|uniref:Rz1 family lipoprotein n=1 Tax=Serratia bockelmannii TaxID=2703793 RepID=UPI00247928D3|nr:Rz1 family lipoprotein [Serratia bockelmannii]MDH7589054.1 Rz1 family lipoprotein [Serratia bockelmannii]